MCWSTTRTQKADAEDTAENFKRMLKTGVEPDEVAYSAPTNAQVNTDEQKAGQEGSAKLLGRRSWAGLGPGGTTYSAMVDALTKLTLRRPAEVTATGLERSVERDHLAAPLGQVLGGDARSERRSSRRARARRWRWT